jgi:hypothetical protein
MVLPTLVLVAPWCRSDPGNIKICFIIQCFEHFQRIDLDSDHFLEGPPVLFGASECDLTPLLIVGKWKIIPQNKMEWCKEGWWRLTKRIVEGTAFEYKYVMVDPQGVMHWWEKENNHRHEIFHPPMHHVSPPSKRRRRRRNTTGQTTRTSNPISPRPSPFVSANAAAAAAAGGPTEYRKHSSASKLHAEELSVFFNCRNRYAREFYISQDSISKC